MAVYFDWDDWKLRKDLREHGIHFDDASLVFEDPIGSPKKIWFTKANNDGEQ